MPDLSRNRDILVERAIDLFVDHPAAHFTTQGLADALGVTLWTVRYHFISVEQMLRAAADRLVSDLGAHFGDWPAPADHVHQTLAADIEALVALLESAAYRNLLFLLLRNGCAHPWLGLIYEREIMQRICRRIETTVLESGPPGQTPVLMADGAARRLFKRLETAFALAPLLPHCGAPVAQDREQLLREAGREAFEATYLFDWRAPAAA